MSDFEQAFILALRLLLSLDGSLMEIVILSLRVSLSALFIAGIVGLPLGAAVAVTRFPGRGTAVVLLNAMMGLPPVVIGLMVYMMLSRAGPLGVLGLLYTPTAMIIAQAILVTPIVAALTWQIVESLESEYAELFGSMRVPFLPRVQALLYDARFGLMTVMLAGFGRALAEVGAVMIVGGNIDHLTRVMTTAIALETAKGDLAEALALGFLLLLIALIVNGAVIVIRQAARRRAYA